ncbi:cupin domain-containing protein [Polaribacter gochangensis]|uniref:cupin domain-containing protein n=1 Tax=Polaribacter gochangensis TaxID=3252903 RepID=UPI003904938F
MIKLPHINSENLFNKVKIIIASFFFFFISCKQKTTLLDPYEAGWKGKKVCEILQDNAKLRVLKCTFPPGVGHEKHYHNTHFGYTITGSKFKITNSAGVKEVDVPTGSDFSNEGVTTHEVLNIGNTTAAFLIIEPK